MRGKRTVCTRCGVLADCPSYTFVDLPKRHWWQRQLTVDEQCDAMRAWICGACVNHSCRAHGLAEPFPEQAPEEPEPTEIIRGMRL